MKVIIQIYKTNPDGSNSLYMMSNKTCGSIIDAFKQPEIKHYGWKHEFPENDKLEQALDLIFDSIEQT